MALALGEAELVDHAQPGDRLDHAEGGHAERGHDEVGPDRLERNLVGVALDRFGPRGFRQAREGEEQRHRGERRQGREPVHRAEARKSPDERRSGDGADADGAAHHAHAGGALAGRGHVGEVRLRGRDQSRTEPGLDAACAEEEGKGGHQRQHAGRRAESKSPEDWVGDDTGHRRKEDRPAAEALRGKTPERGDQHAEQRAEAENGAGLQLGQPDSAPTVGNTAKTKACAEVLMTNAAATIQPALAASSLVTESSQRTELPR